MKFWLEIQLKLKQSSYGIKKCTIDYGKTIVRSRKDFIIILMCNLQLIFHLRELLCIFSSKPYILLLIVDAKENSQRTSSASGLSLQRQHHTEWHNLYGQKRYWH